MLLTPNFTLPSPNPRTDNTTDAVWWLRCHLLQLESSTRDGGTFAEKSGFHGRGRNQTDRGQGNSGTNYSIRDALNRTGPWWRDFSSGFDWTFTTAQGGNYDLIAHYTSLLLKSALDPNDPRLDLVLYDFYGQADWDNHVEGWDELHERDATSDNSHLWHIHFSFLRAFVGDFWAMWALYTVLSQQTVEHWRLSTGGAIPTPTPPTPTTPAGLPYYRNGSRTLRHTVPNMRGTDVLFVQKFGGPSWFGVADGIAGPKFDAGVRRYQSMRGITRDGIVGPQTWRNMGVR